jgi:hypothetical protein
MKPIDYAYWFSFDYWTFEQATYLLCNINPDDKNNINMISDSKYKRLHPYAYVSGDTYDKNLKLIQATNFLKYENPETPIPVGRVSIQQFLNFCDEKKLGRFPSRLKSEWEKYTNREQQTTDIPEHTPTGFHPNSQNEHNDGHFGKQTIDAFDALPLSGIAGLFSTNSVTDSLGKWKKLASKASSNGLIHAREAITGGKAESTFNPVRVANWLISKHGSSPEQLERKLKSNLPDRSKDQKEDIFGID